MFTTSRSLRGIAVASTAATLLGFGIFGLIAATDPAHFDHLARKDNFADTGLIEHLTVLALIPGILAGAFALIRWRKLLPSKSVQVWLLLWTLACIYFAGEECSWGQWYLEFDTPEALTGLNDQGEFNLHNISSWLDQKPRTLVELFVIFAGFLIPVSMLIKKPRLNHKGMMALIPWVLAPAMCWAAGAVFMFQRIASKVDTPWMQRVGTSEFRELGVAWFLALYLLSYALRLAVLSRRQRTPHPGQQSA
ncbi:MAG: hypothetical protein ACNA8P_04075 [Phycisphaerales bacterium]